MGFCVNCGKELPNGARFCSECGTSIKNYENIQKETIYDGVVHKCPQCGELLDSFVINCPACGYELRGAKKVSVVKELADKINQTNSLDRKNDLISNFYIPNTKEDIIEFFILASSNINNGEICIEAWWAKLEQAYQKAKLTFGDSNEFAYLEELYKKTIKQKSKQLFFRKINRSTSSKLLVMGLIGCILTLAGFFLGAATGNEDSPFYILGMIGFFPLMISIFGFIGYFGKKIDKD